LAGSAFKDAEVIKTLSAFTPILVDKDTEKDVIAKYHVGGIPDVRFADAKGEQVGQPIIGAVPTEQFLKSAQDLAKKVKPGKPSKDYATLTGAKADLDAALPKKKVADALAAIAKIEKVNRAGPILDAAVAAKKTLLEDGQKRFDAAKTSAAAADGKDAALKELRKLAAEYKGTDIGTEAAKLVKELDPPKEPGAK
jgi:hypothetical protein